MQGKNLEMENFLLFIGMREEVTIEINGEKVLIGYSAMFVPTNKREQELGEVFKSLRLQPLKNDQEGDIFYFQAKKKFVNGEWKSEWYLIPEFGFISMESPLIDFYMNASFGRDTSFDNFVECIFRQHYWID
jgi:hypothetical protein